MKKLSNWRPSIFHDENHWKDLDFASKSTSMNGLINFTDNFSYVTLKEGLAIKWYRFSLMLSLFRQRDFSVKVAACPWILGEFSSPLWLFSSILGGGVRILTGTNLNQLMDKSFIDQNRIKQRETSTRYNCSSKGEKRLVSSTVKFQVRQIRSTISILAQLFLLFGGILGQHGENFTSTNSCSQIIIKCLDAINISSFEALLHLNNNFGFHRITIKARILLFHKKQRLIMCRHSA